MNDQIKTLRFRTKWLNNTLKVIRTANNKYHQETRTLLEDMAKAK